MIQVGSLVGSIVHCVFDSLVEYLYGLEVSNFSSFDVFSIFARTRFFEYFKSPCEFCVKSLYVLEVWIGYHSVFALMTALLLSSCIFFSANLVAILS